MKILVKPSISRTIYMYYPGMVLSLALVENQPHLAFCLELLPYCLVSWKLPAVRVPFWLLTLVRDVVAIWLNVWTLASEVGGIWLSEVRSPTRMVF